MNPRPLGDRVVVEREPDEHKSDGGLLLPDQYKRQKREGTVVAVGPGRLGKTLTMDYGNRPNISESMHGHADVREEPTSLPMAVKVGDRVVWPLYVEMEVGDGWRGDVVRAQDWNPEGRDLVVIREGDLLAVIEEDK